MVSRVYVALLVVALTGAARAQDPPADPAAELTAAQATALDREIDKLRNGHAAGRAKTEALVIGYGPGAVPALVKAAHTKHAGQQDGLVNCLLALTDADDAGLLEESLASPHVVLRRFAARRAGELKLEPLIDELPPLLEDKDEVVRTEAALSLLSNGREEGLPVAAPALAGPQRERVVAALRGVAGKGDHQNVAAMLVIDKERERFEPEVAAKERLAAVDLLHAIGDPASQALLVKALDDHHNVVQRMAINALRELLEKQPPMDGSSIFQQIKEVERLKAVWNERR
jgi:HEAT repeat protein